LPGDEDGGGEVMEFRKHLAEQRELAESEKEEYIPPTAKVDINELLYRLMPPSTTIEELEQFSVAIFETVLSAWNSH
jgi:hypothetical protein